MIVTLADALSEGRGVERPFCCPVHEDSNASASVNVEKGVWVCYACQASGSIEGYVPSADDIARMLERKSVERVYVESWLDLFDAHEPSPYWATRYGARTARRYRCGTHPFTGRPTYPLRDAGGRVLGVVQRTLDGETDQNEKPLPKYLYPPNTSTSHTLFMSSRAPKRPEVLVLVEGASGVMALEDARWSEAVVAGVYGAGLHLPQVELVNQMAPRSVVFGFDVDDAGDQATGRAFAQLRGLPMGVARWQHFGGSDPGEISSEKAWEAIDQALTRGQRG